MLVKVVEWRSLKIERDISSIPCVRFILKPDDTIELIGLRPRGKLVALKDIANGIPHPTKREVIFLEDGGIDFLMAVSIIYGRNTYFYSTRIFEMEYEKALEGTV